MILIVRTDISIWVLSIVGHIQLDLMEVFQDVPFLTLFQVNWCVLTLIRFNTCDK